VITLKANQTIIKLHLEGVSEREISRRTTKARNTVRKYIKEYEVSRHQDVRNLAITEEIMKKPTIKREREKRRY